MRSGPLDSGPRSALRRPICGSGRPIAGVAPARASGRADRRAHRRRLSRRLPGRPRPLQYRRGRRSQNPRPVCRPPRPWPAPGRTPSPTRRLHRPPSPLEATSHPPALHPLPGRVLRPASRRRPRAGLRGRSRPRIWRCLDPVCRLPRPRCPQPRAPPTRPQLSRRRPRGQSRRRRDRSARPPQVHQRRCLPDLTRRRRRRRAENPIASRPPRPFLRAPHPQSPPLLRRQTVHGRSRRVNPSRPRRRLRARRAWSLAWRWRHWRPGRRRRRTWRQPWPLWRRAGCPAPRRARRRREGPRAGGARGS